MAQVKFTKVELVDLRKKLKLFEKYLPTLQLKKTLLQIEVNKAKEQIWTLQEHYNKEKAVASSHSKLLTDIAISDLIESLSIQNVEVKIDNIAGIDIPILQHVHFTEPKSPVLYQPLWVDDAINLFRELKTSYQKVLIAIKRKEILEHELRVISIRVNLFEKRLIPELVGDINRIKVFLGDQDLQAVAQAKVSKTKIQKKVNGSAA